MKRPAALALLMLCGCASGGVHPTPEDRAKAYAEIRAMGERDQAVQLNATVNPDDDAHNERIEQVFRTQAARLEELLRVHGWPRISIAGEEVAEAVFLMVQHADHDVRFQSECLGLLTAEVARGEARPAWLAYLTDRVRTNKNQPQLYGTQFMTGPDGLSIPKPIEDPDNVDRRRATLGLPPLAEAVERHRRNEREMFERFKASEAR